jgi:hypothetical protein
VIDNTDFHAHGRTVGAWDIAPKVSVNPTCSSQARKDGSGTMQTFMPIGVPKAHEVLPRKSSPWTFIHMGESQAHEVLRATKGST